MDLNRRTTTGGSSLTATRHDLPSKGSRFARPIAQATGAWEDPSGGFLFICSSEICGDPAPEWIPAPETTQVLRRSQALRGGPLRHLRQCAAVHS